MRERDYEEKEREASEKLFRQGAYIVILACHLASVTQWLCYALGGSYWGG